MLLEWQHARTFATIAASSKSVQMAMMMHGQGSISERMMKKARVEARHSDAQEHVKVKVSGRMSDDVEEAQQLEIQMLPSIDSRDAIWIELGSTQLEFVKAALVSAEADTAAGETMRRPVTKLGGGLVRWLTQRGVWLAQRKGGYAARVEMKSFKVVDPHNEAMVTEQHNKAVMWIAGVSDVDSVENLASEGCA